MFITDNSVTVCNKFVLVVSISITKVFSSWMQLSYNELRVYTV